MSDRDRYMKDIDDDEIRIISHFETDPEPKKGGNTKAWLCFLAALLVFNILVAVFIPSGESDDDTVTTEQSVRRNIVEKPAENVAPVVTADAPAHPFVERRDTTVNGVKLMILTPRNATPVLEIGNEVTDDSTAVLIAQAADVRQDNGGIVGAFVSKGRLVSKGEAKAGFCSIIDGGITIGVADATPMLELALTTDGYFFRQYPLVVAGQVVENKPKGRSIRRALAELDGSISVIVSENKVTFHDFSQALIDAGVRNAIYLVGGEAYGRYTASNGSSFTFGHEWDEVIDNVNYIVWR